MGYTNDFTVQQTSPLKSPSCMIPLTVFQQFMHERYSVVVDFYFLHVAQLNQTSYAKHLPSNTDLCAVFKKRGAVWQTSRRDYSGMKWASTANWWLRVHRVIFVLLLPRETITCQRGESGHAPSPGPDPAGAEQLINTHRGSWRGWGRH